MTACEHAYTRTSIVSSTLSDTSYRQECFDCGLVEYVVESVVPVTWTELPSRNLDLRRVNDDIRKDGGRK